MLSRHNLYFKKKASQSDKNKKNEEKIQFILTC